ncbi:MULTISPECIES: hypothetical protein [Acinetobacter]|uniref:hypothetical protein n=1 Tax=Acinetobacter TaxID=469 RepID=UPI0002CEB9FD|nr:hypothetical protein [Acinetobacter courvalinii]ENX06543.1 hypothetical protein F898_03494 [Acinetobacter courvalinii]
MQIPSSEFPINLLLEKINTAAANNESMMLSEDEVKLISEKLGDRVFIPVLTNDQLIKLCQDGKLGQPMK